MAAAPVTNLVIEYTRQSESKSAAAAPSVNAIWPELTNIDCSRVPITATAPAIFFAATYRSRIALTRGVFPVVAAAMKRGASNDVHSPPTVLRFLGD